MRAAIPILLTISISLAQFTREKPIIDRLISSEATLPEKKSIMAQVRTFLEKGTNVDYKASLVDAVRYQGYEPGLSPECVEALDILIAGYKKSENPEEFLKFLSICSLFLNDTSISNDLQLEFFAGAVEKSKGDGRMEDLKEALVDGTWKVPDGLAKALGVSETSFETTIGVTTEEVTSAMTSSTMETTVFEDTTTFIPPSSTIEVTSMEVTTEANDVTSSTVAFEDTTTFIPLSSTMEITSAEVTTEENAMTSSDMETATFEDTTPPSSNMESTSSEDSSTEADASTMPPIDPSILAQLNVAGAHGAHPNTLPDGTPLDTLPEHYAVYDGVNDFTKVVANRYGYYVLSPVQTVDNQVIFDPYTIGQVLGYIYEHEEFKGKRPKNGWTIELMGGQFPQKVSKRKAFLKFIRKIDKKENEYWKKVLV